MEQANRDLLIEGLRAFGVEPSDRSCDAVTAHLAMVSEWNERMNLTAITAEREMVLKHAIDSAAAVKVVQLVPGMRVLDVGTGAGFPGVVWKCLYPEIQVVLLESVQKRCRFLEAVGQDVVVPLVGGEGGYRVLWSRAEDAGRVPGERESYDLVVARAVAELRTLAEYCLPFAKVGGAFLAMKGPGVGEEVDRAQHALSELGGRVESVTEVELPHESGSRSLVLIRKVGATPRTYPRKAGVPAKSPL